MTITFVILSLVKMVLALIGLAATFFYLFKFIVSKDQQYLSRTFFALAGTAGTLLLFTAAEFLLVWLVK